jgi:ankyrin repeat protein
MAQLQPSYRSLNPLHYAVRENDIESVKRYLEERNDPEDIHNALTKYDAQTGGKTPLYYACRYGHGKSVSAELFKFLLEKSTLEVLKFRPSDSDEDDNYNNDEPINVLEVLCQEFKQVSTKDITMRKIELASQRWIELDPNVNHFPDSTTLGIISLANLYSQKVKRKLLIEGGSLMKTMMNKMFVSSSNMALLMHYLYIHILIIFSYSYLLHESILHSTEKNSYDETALVILITCTVSRIVRMLIQVTGPSLDVYVKDPFNLIDLLQIFFLIVNIRLLFLFTSKGDSHDLGEESFRSLSPFERYSIILSTGISWIQLLFISGKFIYSISVFTTALLRVSFFIDDGMYIILQCVYLYILKILIQICILSCLSN